MEELPAEIQGSQEEEYQGDPEVLEIFVDAQRLPDGFQRVGDEGDADLALAPNGNIVRVTKGETPQKNK